MTVQPLPGVEEMMQEIVEDVGLYAYESIGQFVTDVLFVGYIKDATDTFLADLVADGLLVATTDPEPGYQWYRVTTAEEREETD